MEQDTRPECLKRGWRAWHACLRGDAPCQDHPAETPERIARYRKARRENEVA